MKAWIASLTSGAFVAQMMCASVAFAGTTTSPTAGPVVNEAAQKGGGSLNAKPDAGGIMPCLLTCYLGPRVGVEYNEGRAVSTMEWLQLVARIGTLILAFKAMGGTTMSEYAKENGLDSRPIPAPKGNAASKGGITACLVTCYMGPRVALERNEGRKIRSKEIWLIIPILNLIAAILMGLEAYNGMTMTQIARDEGLDG